MRKFAYLLVFSTIIFLPFFAIAQSATVLNRNIAQTLVAKMALQHHLSEAPENIRVQFAQNPLQLPPDKNKQMLQQFDKAYATELLLQDFTSALKQKFTDGYRNLVSQWLENDYISSVTHARQNYYTLQGKRQRVITRYEMDQNPPSPQRINLISTLTDTTSVAESSVESSVIIVRSVIKAVGRLSTQRGFTKTQVDAIANNFRSQLQSQAANQLNQEQLVMYHNIQDEALNNYITFWGTETGHWLDKSISESLQAAYRQAADRFLQSIKST